MGLMANCFRHHHQAAPPEGNAHALLPGNWGSQHQWWKFIAPQDASAVLVTAAHPVGHYLPRVWQAPISVGEMSLRTDGAGDLTGNLIPSRAMALDMTGSGDLEATAGLAVAMALAMTGSGSFSAQITGYLNASLDMTGSGDLSADLSGVANMVLNMLGSGDLEATIAAYGNMELDIVVTGTGLTTANVGQAVWAALAVSNNDAGTMGEKLNDAGSASNPWTEVIESGYTAAEILRLIAAATAGVMTGADTATVTFRDLADSKDRIVADVDATGRTAVTLDPT